MPTPRLHPARVQTSTERTRRTREAQRAYVAALEAAVRDAEGEISHISLWHDDHAPTIARARAARGTAATTTED